MGKISNYPPDTSPTSDDFVVSVDATTGTNRKVTLASLITLFMTSPTISSPVITSPPTNIARLTGEISPYAGRTAPTDWLLCEGSAVSRSTYATLFGVAVPTIGTFTVTIATPAVVTLTAHGLVTGDQVYLTTTGALPTGLTANTLYYIIKVDANSFNLATTRANAYAATKIATSGTQSGTHTLKYCPYGLGDGSTTFNVPDARGRTLAGNDLMGGTAASRLTLARSTGSYGNQGATGGAESHQLVTAELASHAHALGVFNSGAGGGGAPLSSNNTNPAGAQTDGLTGSDTAHNNVQPTVVVNYIIKT